MNYNGILCVDKPAGFTSFDVIAKLRGITRTKRIGHAGTLDPMATGVLPVFFGRAAKAVDLLPNHRKTYIASIRLGITTDTQDITGKTLSQTGFSVSAAQFENALKSFAGGYAQLPPMFSAVRVNGRRLYDIARGGGEIERKTRRVEIYSLDLLEADETAGVYAFCAAVSGGTYIRALCHDIGQNLGCGAAMTALRRTEACGFKAEDCLALDEIQSLADSGGLASKILPVDSAFADMPAFTLTDDQSWHFTNGLEMTLSRFNPPPPDGVRVRAYCNGEFLGLAEADYSGVPSVDGRLKIIKLFSLGENQ